MRYLPIIGLEIHVRLKTKSKMFCACPNVEETTAPNTAICPVCTGQPGALPAVNAEAIRLGVRVGLALKCTIPDQAHFDRKNYFYPDLPKGYQISQYDHPIAEHGHVDVEVAGQEPPRDRIRIGITRAHLEEDAAKNIHDAKSNTTLVDFNRAGTPLVEIVTEPDLRSPAEAKTFLQDLQAMLRAVNASDADMEKGYMRCDANVSLLPVDEKNLPLQNGYNPKIEIKNINSFRAVERAIAYEIERQTKMLNQRETPQGATRGWDENKGETFEQRIKETNADYRYFPEPDLPQLLLLKIRDEEKSHLPELPNEKRMRLKEEFLFSDADIKFFIANEGWSDYAEHVMDELASWKEAIDQSKKSASELMQDQQIKLARLAGGWLTSKLQGILSAKNLTIHSCHITPENFAEFLTLVERGTVNSANALKLLTLMVERGADPSHLLEEHNLGQSDDPKLIAEIVERLIRENPKQVAEVKAGKEAVIKWFVGCVMKASEGRANPQAAEEEVRKQIVKQA